MVMMEEHSHIIESREDDGYYHESDVGGDEGVVEAVEGALGPSI